METRVAVMSIIVEDPAAVQKAVQLFHRGGIFHNDAHNGYPCFHGKTPL